MDLPDIPDFDPFRLPGPRETPLMGPEERGGQAPPPPSGNFRTCYCCGRQFQAQESVVAHPGIGWKATDYVIHVCQWCEVVHVRAPLSR